MRLDVAIVGAGPAGAWTACQVAKTGARVAIFDASHPREKPCGGGVTGRALALVSGTIGGGCQTPDSSVSDTDRSRCLTPGTFVPVRRARFGRATVPLADRALFVVSRQVFDAALLDAARHAGATLVSQRVVDVAVDAGSATIHTSTGTHRADMLVGADGANSLVRRRVAAAFRRDQLSIATGFYADGVTSDEIVVEFVDDPPGYIWSFPRPDHLAIGICAQANAGTTAGELRARTDAWIRETGLARGATLRTYAWPIPSLGARDLDAPVSGPRWLLVGDAAGFVDPITREGIFFGLRSADHAAAALAERLPGASYEARVRGDITPELARAARLKAGFFTPTFIRLLLTALDRSAAIRSVTADLVAGRQSYRTLKWRLLNTFEFGLAWDALKQC